MKGPDIPTEIVVFFANEEELKDYKYLLETTLESHQCSAPESDASVFCKSTSSYMPDVTFVQEDVKVSYENENELQDYRVFLEQILESHKCADIDKLGRIRCKSGSEDLPSVTLEKQ